MSYGKARKTSRKMAEDGLTAIPPATLDYWKKVSDVGRYEQLRREVEKRRDFNAAERMDALVARTLELEEKILDQAEEKMNKIDPKDLANAYKNFAIGSGGLQDKSDRIKVKPTITIDHRYDLAEIQRAMDAILDSVEQEESVDAEVVELPSETDRSALEG
jgi:hypothetical protein